MKYKNKPLSWARLFSTLFARDLIQFNELVWKAVRTDDGPGFRMLLEVGANPNLTDDQGNTLLHCAARHGSQEAARLLIYERDADMSARNHAEETPLHTAVEHDQLPITRMLIAARSDIEACNRLGMTPLYCAARCGNADLVTVLLDQGANPNVTARAGMTPLHAAALAKDCEVARRLFAGGARLDVADVSGLTPLHIAAFDGNLPLADLLLVYGSNPNLQDSEGATPAHIAARGGYAHVVERLIGQEGIDLGIYDSTGRTPARLAARHGHSAIAIALDIALALDEASRTPLRRHLRRIQQLAVRPTRRLGY